MSFLLFLAALAWYPPLGSGPRGEFLLVAANEAVVLIQPSGPPNGHAGCFFSIDARRVYVFDRRTGDWTSAVGEFCTVEITGRRGAAISLRITFAPGWLGQRTVYVLEPPGGWYRAGTWDIMTDAIPFLPPMAGPPGEQGIQGIPGPVGPRGEAGIPRVVRFTAGRQMVQLPCAAEGVIIAVAGDKIVAQTVSASGRDLVEIDAPEAGWVVYWCG